MVTMAQPEDEPSSTARVIDGKAIAQEIREEIREFTEELVREHGVTPGLAVVLVGNRTDSSTYVRMKKKAAAEKRKATAAKKKAAKEAAEAAEAAKKAAEAVVEAEEVSSSEDELASQPDADDEGEEVDTTEFEVNGVTYWRTTENTVYGGEESDPQEVGKWDEEKECIVFNKEE